jgi:hypothetical protein
MENFTLAELGVFLGVLGGVLTSLILTIQKSKCKEISICPPKCIRDPTIKSTDSVPIPPTAPPIAKP